MSHFIPAGRGPLETIHIPLEPLGATAQWHRAAEAAGYQCQQGQWRPVDGPERPRDRHDLDRCPAGFSGGHKLYLAADGRVYCRSHFDALRRASTPKAAKRAAQDGPDLFDLLADQEAGIDW